MCSIGFLKRNLTGKMDDTVLRDIATAEQCIDDMTRMANDLLDVSRLEQNRMPVTREPNDLIALVRTAVENMRLIDPTREFSVDADGSLHVACDRELIRRVVENLVSNGIKHTPAGRPLRIRVSSGEEARVAIEDRGPGVPVAYREAIFEKFGTLSARQNAEYHSSGLGLAFCKLAVEAHGGRIGVSGEQGEGSTFWFTLPAGVAVASSIES
jgi:signal transduction histidine kinase